MVFTFGNCGKNRGRYHYLLHIVRPFFIFTDLHGGKKPQYIRQGKFTPFKLGKHIFFVEDDENISMFFA